MVLLEDVALALEGGGRSAEIAAVEAVGGHTALDTRSRDGFAARTARCVGFRPASSSAQGL